MPDRVQIHALCGDRPGAEPVGVRQESEDEMLGQDLGVVCGPGLVLRDDHDLPCARSESAESLIRVEVGGLPGVLGDEPLLRGLLGDPHTFADFGPRRPRPPGLVDEVTDEVVREFAEVFGGENRVGELLERGLRVHLLDRVDEVVEADGRGDGR